MSTPLEMLPLRVLPSNEKLILAVTFVTIIMVTCNIGNRW